MYLSTGQGVLGCNCYCYCGNNPGNTSDQSGIKSKLGTIFEVIGIGLLIITEGIIIIGSGGTLAIPASVALYSGSASMASIGAGIVADLTDSIASGTSFFEKRRRKNLPSSPGELQLQIDTGKAPDSVTKAHKGHVEGQEDHVHFDDKKSLTITGKVHDKMRGKHGLTNKERKWLRNNGWLSETEQ